MTLADRIRQFAVDHYISPAKANGLPNITIRAGDIHQAMGLMSRLPAVCSAIGSNKFEDLASVSSLGRTGPENGANVFFNFSLGPRTAVKLSRVAHLTTVDENHPKPATKNLSLSDALVLVSCVKTKRAKEAPARMLYTSPWFLKVRDLVEGSNARWFVLSALYGLVAPDAKIAPYELTLNTLGVRERKAWAKRVLEKLLPIARGQHRIVMFAGSRYREFLIEPLRREGIAIEVPMADLRLGEQLAWLSKF